MTTAYTDLIAAVKALPAEKETTRKILLDQLARVAQMVAQYSAAPRLDWPSVQCRMMWVMACKSENPVLVDYAAARWMTESRNTAPYAVLQYYVRMLEDGYKPDFVLPAETPVPQHQESIVPAPVLEVMQKITDGLKYIPRGHKHTITGHWVRYVQAVESHLMAVAEKGIALATVQQMQHNAAALGEKMKPTTPTT